MTDDAKAQGGAVAKRDKHTFVRGDEVETWFDTGAFGVDLLYGKVIAAGGKCYRVLWESGLSNRLEQGNQVVRLRSHHS